MNGVRSQVCRVCDSPDTIRTGQTRSYDAWYCYQCRRGFEVLHDTTLDPVSEQPGPRHRIASEVTAHPRQYAGGYDARIRR